MAAYYNEFDPYAAQWLRNLIKAGLIADGEVDERSIHLVRPDDVRGFIQCHFFAGIGGWSLALRLAGIADCEPVWTGSCPCQPFSAAGRQKGFDDERHLWPVFRNLIAECRPASFLGEQVASAADWLRLVRGDLEALGYAVGAIPIEAASAGADHKRDRYWIVAHADDAKWRSDVAGRNDDCREEAGRQQGDGDVAERGGGDVAHADLAGLGEGREQRSGQFGGTGGDPQACHVEHSTRLGRREGRAVHAECSSEWPAGADSVGWIAGADGKARRLPGPGIRLLAHGVSGRVAVRRAARPGGPENEEEIHWYNRIGALRGFGNAIDPRPAAEFIRAAMGAAP